jgi:two-component system, NtrC family, nitrogen regulation sensor histidine kinase NtrY
MVTKHTFRKYLYAWISVTAISLLIVLGVQFYFKIHNDPQQICDRLNSQIHIREKSLSKNLKLVATRLKQKNDADINSLLDSLNKRGSDFLIFENNLLSKWSTNTIPVNQQFDSLQFANRIAILNNGWYLIDKIKTGNLRIVAVQLIKHQYNFENEYLANSFSSAFDAPSVITLSTKSGKYNIYSAQHSFLFSLQADNIIPYTENILFLLIFLYILFTFCLLNLIFSLYLIFNSPVKNRTVVLTAYIIDILILRFIILYFGIPHVIHQSQLFSPLFYASSSLLPSLGEFLIDALFGLFLAAIFYKYFRIKPHLLIFKNGTRYLLLSIIYLISSLLFLGMITSLNSLVLNSNISLNFHNILGFTQLGIVSFIITASLVLALFLILSRLTAISLLLNKSLNVQFGYSLASALLFFFFAAITPVDKLVYSIFLFFILSGNCYFLKINQFIFPSRNATLYFLILMSVMCTYSLGSTKNAKEKEERKLIAIRLSEDRDQLAEYFFGRIGKAIHNDDSLQQLFNLAKKDVNSENEITNYVKKTYFSNYWSKYTLQFTICYPGKKLSVKPTNYIIDCSAYFSKLTDRIGQPTGSPQLFHLAEGYDITSYLAALHFTQKQDNILQPVDIYVEISSKNAPQDSGYPELLMDNSQKQSVSNISNYSYAIYSNGELVKNVGSYFYGFTQPKLRITTDFIFFSRNGYSHLYHPVNNSTVLILSRKSPGFTDIIAPFSYFFIFFSIFFLIIYILLRFSLRLNFVNQSFKFKLQLALIGIILIATVGIGSVTIYYLVNININKNKDILTEKLHTVLIEIEDKFGNSPELTPLLSDSLSNQLTKYSDAYFTDINMYDPKGNLLVSSRQAIFDEGLIAGVMNAEAYSQLSDGRKTLVIQNESIGKYQYLSAYIPFRNSNNKLIGYLNLPYFARQTSLRQEISTFLVAFTNIYAILTALAVVLALLISNYISRPLKLISDKLGKVKLGKTNEKIDWPRQDEIGGLISEYNRMIEALTESADMLARSERESAWREMAKQVAHEIKNPLTPIKLSVQLLQKAYDEKAPDWEIRLNNFTHTLIQQIDTLAAIATEFSDFAQMPQAKNKKVELVSIIQTAIVTFSETPGITIHFSEHRSLYYTWADEKQLLRVFNNLIKNAIQAIPHSRNGKIEIGISSQHAEIHVSIKDNGTGIPDTESEKIFSPNFTTKSGGSGLGLSIVQKIISQSGGRIWFYSGSREGTTFHLALPVFEEKN